MESIKDVINWLTELQDSKYIMPDDISAAIKILTEQDKQKLARTESASIAEIIGICTTQKDKMASTFHIERVKKIDDAIINSVIERLGIQLIRQEDIEWLLISGKKILTINHSNLTITWEKQ